MKALTLLVLFATSASAQDALVSQKDKTFAPGELTVKRGQTVTFRNDDVVSHNVFSKDAKFNLKLQAPGEQKSFVFDEPGVHEVRCAIHPKMVLKVTVTP